MSVITTTMPSTPPKPQDCFSWRFCCSFSPSSATGGTSLGAPAKVAKEAVEKVAEVAEGGELTEVRSRAAGRGGARSHGQRQDSSGARDRAPLPRRNRQLRFGCDVPRI